MAVVALDGRRLLAGSAKLVEVPSKGSCPPVIKLLVDAQVEYLGLLLFIFVVLLVKDAIKSRFCNQKSMCSSQTFFK